MKWKKFIKLGADNAFRTLYRNYEMFSSIRKLDLQFSVLILYTGCVYFRNLPQDWNGLVPNILLFFVELLWEKAGSKGTGPPPVTFVALHIPM